MASHLAAAARGHGAAPLVAGDLLVVHTQAGLGTLLSRCRNVFKPLAVRKVSLRIDTINAGVAQRSEARLNAILLACGCNTANAAGCIGLLGYALGLFVARGAPTHWLWIHLWSGIVLCLAAIVLARALHHLRTRRRLVRELRLLIAQTQGSA